MAGRKGMKGENLGGSRPGAGRNAKWFRAQKTEHCLVILKNAEFSIDNHSEMC